MTPQPEESPDKILARRIVGYEKRIADMKNSLKYSEQHGNALRELKTECLRQEKNLAMLEAMRASRPGLKALSDIANWFGEKLPDDYNIMLGSVQLTLGQCRQAREAYRQSGDAIRGMRG